jgi:hypothetical protein
MKWGKNQQELHMAPPPSCIRPRGEAVAILFSCCRKFEFLCRGDVNIFALFLLGACDSVVDPELFFADPDLDPDPTFS